jgi:hypothetical protein
MPLKGLFYFNLIKGAIQMESSPRVPLKQHTPVTHTHRGTHTYLQAQKYRMTPCEEMD